ncbi:Retrovirus-related Pol polyprotein, partial [Mucuna pruriens]
MTVKTKIDVHARTLSMEFRDNLVHPTEDHSLCSMDVIDELVEKYNQFDSSSNNMKILVEISNMFESRQQTKAGTDLANLMSTSDPFPVIVANNLDQEQEEKLLTVLQQHKKSIGWKLSNLPGINPSICMHIIMMEEEARPIRQQQRRLNPTILDVMKKEVTKLLATGIIYPISDSNWVSLIQVVPKKSRIIVTKSQHDEMVLTRIQNSWRVCIDYRKLNQATCKDHFPLPFLDQILKKLAGKSHYCFLDGYSRKSFGLYNAPSTFKRCMLSIFSGLLEECIEVFIDDFTVYADTFEACLNNLSHVLKRCVETNLVLNYEKCHFMVTKAIVLSHMVSNRGI